MASSRLQPSCSGDSGPTVPTANCSDHDLDSFPSVSLTAPSADSDFARAAAAVASRGSPLLGEPGVISGRLVEGRLGRLGPFGRSCRSRLVTGQSLLRSGQFLIQPGRTPRKRLGDSGQFLVVSESFQGRCSLRCRRGQRLCDLGQLRQGLLGRGQHVGCPVPVRLGAGQILLRCRQSPLDLGVFGRDGRQGLLWQPLSLHGPRRPPSEWRNSRPAIRVSPCGGGLPSAGY
ncbi:MAG: hypothetical protein Ct9H300mP1_26140 [Planctomycetaceae bacterium]|nr:MAG: hypothetical protein Ct9H300mP1_26140 [Planctomycetaceae bacterium]